MSENELYIRVKNTSENTLVGFPYVGEQYFSHEEDSSDADNESWLVVDLGDRTDTTAMQEQFLNTNHNVLEYTIR